jgi:DNA helicase-4
LPAAVQLTAGGAVNLPCLEVIAISVSKALLWHSVEVSTRNGTHSLSCLGEDAATGLAAGLYRFINSHLFDLIGSDTKHLSEVDTKNYTRQSKVTGNIWLKRTFPVRLQM